MDRLYIHIGAHRTGTTYLQTALHLNRAALERQGIDTLSDLSLWGQGQHNAAFACLGWALREDARTQAQYREAVRQRLLASALPAAVLSSEFFELFDAASIARLRGLLGGVRTVLVYWLRDQPQYFASYYRESFKQGQTQPFGQWLEARAAAGLGDFHGVLRRWREHLAPEAVRIVVYDNLVRAGANLFECFAREILRLPASEPLALPAQALINRSVDARLMRLLHEMNRRHGAAESHVKGIGAKYLRMRRRLEQAYQRTPSLAGAAQPAQIIDAALAESIRQRFAAGNARLLQEFGADICNPTPGGALFPPPLPAVDAAALPELTEAQWLDLLFNALNSEAG